MKTFWHHTALKKWIILIVISAVMEIFLFNIRHFELLTCKSDTRTFSFTAETIPVILGTDQKSGIRLIIDSEDNIPEDLRNFAIELSEPVQSIIVGNVYTQETGFLSGHTREFRIIPGVLHSQTVYLYPSNRVEKITLDLFDTDPQTILLSLNQSIPIRVNWFRLICIFAFLAILDCIRPNSQKYKIVLNLHHAGQKAILFLLIAFQISLAVFSVFSTYENINEAVQKGNIREEDYFYKQHYQLLTEALFQGSFSVLMTPPEKLTQVNNPYDPLQRIDQFPEYEWDMSFYKGKYYVYFGIIPALTFYMPYTLLFHAYPLNDFAVLFFAIISIFGLVYCYTWFIRRFFSNIPAVIFFTGLMLFLNSTFLIWCVRRSFSYELALVSALSYSITGLSFILSAMQEDRIRKWKVVIGCFLMACAVGCRPTSILVSCLNLPLFLYCYIHYYRNGHLSGVWKLVLCAVIPYLVVGSGLIFYNQVRFDSIFEFGRTYQLSTQESGTYMNGLPISSFLIGVVNYIFGNPGILKDYFPFLKAGNGLFFNYSGTKEFENIFPVSAVCPLVCILSILPLLWKKMRNKGFLFCSFVLILIILGISLSGITGMMVGTIQRYSLDTSWMLVLASLLMAFLVLENLNSISQQKVFYFIFAGCFLISGLYLLPLSCGESWMGRSWFEFLNPVLFHKIGYFFAFWL